MTNEELLNIITELCNQINISFVVLQDKYIDDNKLYPGYIYINDWMSLTTEQNNFINNNIANILYDNDWEILFDFSNNIDYIKEEYFPIYEEIKL